MHLRHLIIVITAMAGLALLYGWLAGSGYLGQSQHAGEVSRAVPPAAVVQERQQRSSAVAEGATGSRQILFGDLHVHTTFSNDAYVSSLPFINGEGAHPPADACDYARFCSSLDFWSITDHAVSLDHRRWSETKDSIRQCNAATDPQNPDVVAFLGYEWTQAESDADNHYGHKNVIFRHTDDGRVPKRPIYAETRLSPTAFNPTIERRIFLALQHFPENRDYLNWFRYIEEMEADPACPKERHTLALPVTCREGARTPQELFRKLDEAGHDAIVIPHGNTWGLYTPPRSSWDKQLAGAMQDDKRQFLVEVFSGHGNSEEYRDWRGLDVDASGRPVCPSPREDYLPVCWQAGEIIRSRCRSLGLAEAECETLAQNTRQLAAAEDWPMPIVTAAKIEEWLDSGQCRDCFMPAFNYRPGGSAQYALAIGNFNSPESIRRFRFGFIASSDNHTARPGTGYKEIDRVENTESWVIRDPTMRRLMLRGVPGPQGQAVPVAEQGLDFQQTAMPRMERNASFFMTGGLVAVHAEGRNRDAIWNALQRKQVYGTSGDRIMLWFDLLNGGTLADEEVPMGGETRIGHVPRFRVQALGAYEQQPGCPDYAARAIGSERLDRLCNSECYHPSEQRKQITRIEVVRIRPQVHAGEAVSELIEDSWLSLPCESGPEGCSVEFDDPEYVESARDTVYYVRAIEEPSEAVNGDTLRCRRDENGQCLAVRPCVDILPGVERDDDCTALVEERAWSSPIFVDFRPD